MVQLFTSMVYLWRKMSSVLLTADGQGTKNSAFLVYAKVLGAVGGTTTAVIYDGDSAGGVARVNLKGEVTGEDSFNPSLPLYFDSGIYVDLGAGATSVLLVFIPVKR